MIDIINSAKLGNVKANIAVNRIISEYRLLALNKTGYLKAYCNQEANRLEKMLNVTR